MEVSEIQEIHVIPISDSSFQVEMNRFRPINDKTDREMIRDRTDCAKTIRDIEEPIRCMLQLILKNHSIWQFKKKGKVLEFSTPVKKFISSQMGNKTLDELADISTEHQMIPELLSPSAPLRQMKKSKRRY